MFRRAATKTLTLTPPKVIDTIVSELEAELPPGAEIVTNLRIDGHPFDAIVIFPQGLLVVLHIKDWTGSITPSFDGPWTLTHPSGEEEILPNPGDEVYHRTSVLTSLLEKKLPQVHPLIDHVLVLADPAATPPDEDATWPPVVTRKTLAPTVLSMNQSAVFDLLSPKDFQALVATLGGRSMTQRQPKIKPFIFRSGRGLGNGHKVYSVKAAIAHMDRHPEDGILHLRNGTLEHWLRELGEDELADLAHEITHQPFSDPRAQLEAFLLRTGLTSRPRLVVEPSSINLGSVVLGEQVNAVFHIEKGRGRGYLYGQLKSGHPWLRVEPLTFSGNRQEVKLFLDTQALPITDRPQETTIEILSNAGEQPVQVPVRFQVVGAPTPLASYLVRPLASVLLIGLAGLGIGAGLERAGMPALSLPGILQPYAAGARLPIPLDWSTWLAFLGGILGLWHGLSHPGAWSISHAMRQWLRCTAKWTVSFLGLALAAVLSWRWFQPDLGVPTGGSGGSGLLLLALAGAILLGTLENIRRSHLARRNFLPEPRPLRRQVLAVVVGMMAVILLVAGLNGVTSLWKAYNLDDAVGSVEAKAKVQLDRWEASLNRVTDQVLLRYYDRRAPSRFTPDVNGALPLPEEGRNGPGMTGPF